LRSIPFDSRPRVDTYTMSAFWLLQFADVWTTDRGMDYDCVFEANPLLPEVPSFDRLILHKTLFLSPFYTLEEEDSLTYGDMVLPFVLTAYVVHNNLQVIDRASQRCKKR